MCISVVLLMVCFSGFPNRRNLRAPDWVAFGKPLDIHIVSYCIPLTTGFGWVSDMGSFVTFQSWERVGIISMVASLLVKCVQFVCQDLVGCVVEWGCGSSLISSCASMAHRKEKLARQPPTHHTPTPIAMGNWHWSKPRLH